MPLIEAATSPRNAGYLHCGARRGAAAATPLRGGTKHPQAAAKSATDWLRLPQMAPMWHLQQQYCRESATSHGLAHGAQQSIDIVVCSYDVLELTAGRQNYCWTISAAALTCSGTSCFSVLAASSGLLCSSTPTDAVCRVTRFSCSFACTTYH